MMNNLDDSITIDLVDDIEDHQVAPAEPIGILDIRPIDMRKPKQSCKNFNVIVRLGKCQVLIWEIAYFIMYNRCVKVPS